MHLVCRAKGDTTWNTNSKDRRIDEPSPLYPLVYMHLTPAQHVSACVANMDVVNDTTAKVLDVCKSVSPWNSVFHVLLP